MSWGNVPIDQEKKKEQLKECTTCGRTKVSCPTPDGDEICPNCGDKEMMDYEPKASTKSLEISVMLEIVNWCLKNGFHFSNAVENEGSLAMRITEIYEPHLQQKEVTQTPNLEEVAKVTGRIANIAEDYVYTEDGDTACFNKEHFRHEIYPIVLKISRPILATKEHDEELLREFQEWFNSKKEWAYDDTSTIIDENVTDFITSRKVNDLEKGK